MGTYQLNPIADWRNDGWALTGASTLHQAWVSGSGSVYSSSPASKGIAAVTFPLDVTGVPAGAVITSVTVNISCSQGSASPPSEQSPAVTVNLSSLDATSREIGRTMYPTSTSPTFMVVGTFKLDPTGAAWDIHRLNQMIVKISTPVVGSDLIRFYGLNVVANYRVAPKVVVTGPAGAQLTAAPTASWTYSQADGDAQAEIEYKVFSAAQVAVTAFDPNTAVPVFGEANRYHGDTTSFRLLQSLTPGVYWMYIRSHSVFEAISPWAGRQFSVAGPLPGVPGVPDPTGNTVGTGIIQTVPDSSQGAATLSICDTSNMMSVQDASASTLTDGTTWTGANCTAGVRDTTVTYPGDAASWQMTSTASGDMSLVGDWIEATANSAITARAQLISAATARNVTIRLSFYDSNFVSTGADVVSVPVADSVTSWTEAVASTITPTGTQLVVPTVTVGATAAPGEVHNVARVGVMYGTGTAFSDGGNLSRNMLSAWYSNAEGSPGAGESWVGDANTAVAVVSPLEVGASGNTCQAMTYTLPMATVGFVARGTYFAAATTGNAFTLNSPAGILPGHFMLAYVWTSGEDLGQISVPFGWALVDTATLVSGVRKMSQFVLMRTAGASEPSTWTDGTFPVNTAERLTVVVAYSGAADASLQFIAEDISSSPNATPTQITSPTVTNTDPGAWRASAFGFIDDHTGATVTANQQAPGTIPAIAFVGRATAWKTDGGTTSAYVINRPTGVASGNLMVATLDVAGTVTVTAPSGWTVAWQGHAGNLTKAVLYKYAASSNPASWTGSMTGSFTASRARITECVAYRNIHPTVPFSVQSGAVSGAAGSIHTPTLINPSARGWRIASFGYRAASSTTSTNWSSTEVAERADDGVQLTTVREGVGTALYDSKAPVGSAGYSDYGTSVVPFYGAAAWLGMLNPLATSPGSPANETARGTGAVGTTPVLFGFPFDSNGPISTGDTSVTGTFTPGSGTGIFGATAWVGIISPDDQSHVGYSSAAMGSVVDISNVNPTVGTVAGNQLSAVVAFDGSEAGTPYLTMNFYRANQLLSTATQQGTPFDGITWEKSACTFPIPSGTTRVALGVGVADRQNGDVTYFDRVSIAYGDEDVYRAGTSRGAHSVWAQPQLEYADDSGAGYGPFKVISGTVQANPPSYDALTGFSQYVDHTVVPLTNRKYRAKTVCHGLAGDDFSSAYGPTSAEFSFTAESWWIKDVANPANNIALRVRFDTVTVNTTNTAVPYQGLGADLPTVLSEGVKGDTFTITVAPMVHEEWVQLTAVLRSGTKMFLQSDIDQSWWVRMVGDLSVDWLATDARKSNPLRAMKVTLMQVSPPL